MKFKDSLSASVDAKKLLNASEYQKVQTLNKLTPDNKTPLYRLSVTQLDTPLSDAELEASLVSTDYKALEEIVTALAAQKLEAHWLDPTTITIYDLLGTRVVQLLSLHEFIQYCGNYTILGYNSTTNRFVLSASGLAFAVSGALSTHDFLRSVRGYVDISKHVKAQFRAIFEE